MSGHNFSTALSGRRTAAKYQGEIEPEQTQQPVVGFSSWAPCHAAHALERRAHVGGFTNQAILLPAVPNALKGDTNNPPEGICSRD